jgi:hypothetical protein
MEFARKKPRHWGLSIAYRINRLLPRKLALDLMLDAAWIAWRLAHENAVDLGLFRQEPNDFLLREIAPMIAFWSSAAEPVK